jgi:RNA polymerase sigma-70 factor (ECF subfamily)
LLLEKKYLKQVDPNRGRFRSFLLASLKHYLSNEWDYRTAQKRGAGKVLDLTSAEERYQKEPFDQATPEQIYERKWAMEVLDRVMSLVQDEMIQTGKSERFEVLKPYLTGESEMLYRQVSETLKISEGAVKAAVLRLRRRFGEILKQEVSRTVENPDHVRSEIEYLLGIARIH